MMDMSQLAQSPAMLCFRALSSSHLRNNQAQSNQTKHDHSPLKGHLSFVSNTFTLQISY